MEIVREIVFFERPNSDGLLPWWLSVDKQWVNKTHGMNGRKEGEEIPKDGCGWVVVWI